VQSGMLDKVLGQRKVSFSSLFRREHKGPSFDAAALKKLVDENPERTYRELGEHFNCSRQRIQQVLSTAFGYRRKEEMGRKRKSILAFHSQGLSIKEIVAKGFSPCYVRALCSPKPEGETTAGACT